MTSSSHLRWFDAVRAGFRTALSLDQAVVLLALAKAVWGLAWTGAGLAMAFGWSALGPVGTMALLAGIGTLASLASALEALMIATAAEQARTRLCGAQARFLWAAFLEASPRGLAYWAWSFALAVAVNGWALVAVGSTGAAYGLALIEREGGAVNAGAFALAVCLALVIGPFRRLCLGLALVRATASKESLTVALAGLFSGKEPWSSALGIFLALGLIEATFEGALSAVLNALLASVPLRAVLTASLGAELLVALLLALAASILEVAWLAGLLALRRPVPDAEIILDASLVPDGALPS